MSKPSWLLAIFVGLILVALLTYGVGILIAIWDALGTIVNDPLFYFHPGRIVFLAMWAVATILIRFRRPVIDWIIAMSERWL